MYAKTVWIYSHIRKCGGTTFKSILRRNFRSSFLHSSSIGLSKAFYSKEVMQEAIQRNDFVKCFGGHELSLNLPYENFQTESKQITGLAFVRNPVDRFFSFYFYKKNKPVSRFYENEILEKNLNLDQYIENIFDNSKNYEFDKKFPFENPYWSQVYHLSGGICDSNELEQFLLYLTDLSNSQKILLFPTNQFNDACLILESLFSEDFKDCSYVRANESKRDVIVPNYLREQVTHLLDNSLDSRLYKLAQDQLHQLTTKAFPSDQAFNQKYKNFSFRNTKRDFLVKKIKPHFNNFLSRIFLHELVQ